MEVLYCILSFIKICESNHKIYTKVHLGPSIIQLLKYIKFNELIYDNTHYNTSTI
jgi:hypothetical protein